jgi:ribosome-binding protein aMBF1 (putative translation factor)
MCNKYFYLPRKSVNLDKQTIILNKTHNMGNLEQEAIRLIKLKLKEKGWSSSVLASKIEMHPSSVAKMLASDQIKLDRLKLISELLGYNFLRALADQIDVNDPPKYTMEDATKERLHELEIENATLLKVLGK